MSDDDPYLYPGTKTLRNKLAIRSATELEVAERALVTQRIAEGVPPGDFDLGHLCAIHRHLFQDVYDWAGEVRTVELGKGGSGFMPRQFIENGMRDVHRRITEGRYLRGLSGADFAAQVGPLIGDVNHAHPFREGNGRTQLQYLKQLAEGAGHALDLRRIEAERWIEASREANRGNYQPMSGCIADTITEPQRQRDDGRKEQLQARLDRARVRGRDDREQER